MSAEQLEALKKEIWRRAREKAESILMEAEREAERILEEARRKAEESARSKIESEKLLLRRRILGRAVSDGRKMIILAKNEAVEKVFERALEKLRKEVKSRSEAYKSFLRRSLEEALKYISGPDAGEIVICANESDLDLLADMVKDTPVRVKLEKAPIMGGINAFNTGGRKSYYGSIESRLEALKPVLHEKVSILLFREVEMG